MFGTSVSVADVLKSGRLRLKHSDSPVLDCEILLLKVLNDAAGDKVYSKTWLLTWPETELSPLQIQQFTQLLEQRAQGMPIAYITGYKDFWSFSLAVTTDTLIPRPETELLVECALEKIAPEHKVNILDLGTGSGAIGLAIASERSLCRVLATDFCPQALNIARKNAQRLKITNILFCQSHWFADIPVQRFDLIVSNPPYIAANDPHLADDVRHHEPLTALLAEQNGLADIEAIIKSSREYLQPGGWLLFEHGFAQAEAVRVLFLQSKYSNISTLEDLNQQPRVTLAQLL